ncbi:hypothetical protein OUZ56_005692 [Daphnia magna]|uniref:Uncharacterized protein n=1 Tax=Daphnia magna TaxID=35525 RepID=A0ABQ9YTI0_9CRUS|nr:hypothetical protein OUZ56_005692 [Daphnia magna]
MAAVRTGLTNSKPRTAPKSKTAKPNRRFGDFWPLNRGSPRSKTIGAEPYVVYNDGPRGKIPQVGMQTWQLSIRSWSIGPERTNTPGRNSALATQHPILVY